VAVVSKKKDLALMEKLFHKKWDQVTVLSVCKEETLTEEDIRPFKILSTNSANIEYGNYEAIVALVCTSPETIKILLQAACRGCLPICPEDPVLREFFANHCRQTFPASAVEKMMLLPFLQLLEELNNLSPPTLEIQRKELGEHVQKNFSSEQVVSEFLTILEKRVQLYKDYVQEGYTRILCKNLEFYKESSQNSEKDPYSELGDQFPDMNEYYALQLS
jgi:hypothetical protein